MGAVDDRAPVQRHLGLDEPARVVARVVQPDAGDGGEAADVEDGTLVEAQPGVDPQSRVGTLRLAHGALDAPLLVLREGG